jgi:hypothetical protein
MHNEIWKWNNKTRVTDDNILTEDHEIEVFVTDDLTDAQRDKMVLATVKRAVQQRFRVELKESENPRFLHETYIEEFSVNASDLLGKERDPRAAAKKNIRKLKESMTKDEIRALLLEELGE